MTKHKYLSLLILLLTIIIAFTSPKAVQAWLQTYEVTRYSEYGFFSGLWHGIIAPFAFIAQLFDHDIIMYSSVNSGFRYNLGFLLGISMIIGGGAKSTNRSEKI